MPTSIEVGREWVQLSALDFSAFWRKGMQDVDGRQVYLDDDGNPCLWTGRRYKRLAPGAIGLPNVNDPITGAYLEGDARDAWPKHELELRLEEARYWAVHVKPKSGVVRFRFSAVPTKAEAWLAALRSPTISRRAQRGTFWARASNGRLWHMVVEGETRAICGRAVPTPRSHIMRFTLPGDDVRCAACSRALPIEKDPNDD